MIARHLRSSQEPESFVLSMIRQSIKRLFVKNTNTRSEDRLASAATDREVSQMVVRNRVVSILGANGRLIKLNRL